MQTPVSPRSRFTLKATQSQQSVLSASCIASTQGNVQPGPMPTWRADSGGAEQLLAFSQGGGGSWSLITPVECAQRKLGQRSQTVTLSDPYWNSQQHNNGTLTNLIPCAMTRNIIVSVWWKIEGKKSEFTCHTVGVESRLSIIPGRALLETRLLWKALCWCGITVKQQPYLQIMLAVSHVVWQVRYTKIILFTYFLWFFF